MNLTKNRSHSRIKKIIWKPLERSHFKNLFPIGFIILICTPMFALRRIEFDGGHEGYLITTAIAQATGYKIFTDFFSLYGFVLPWIQSIVMVFPVSLVTQNLRTLDSILVLSALLLLYDATNYVKNDSKINKKNILIFTLAWMSLGYFFQNLSLHPWSSTIVIFEQCLSLNLAARIFYQGFNSNRKKFKNRTLIFLGVILGLLPFTRLNSGLASLFFMEVSLILALRFQILTKKQLIIINSYFLFTILSILLFFFNQGSLSLMFEQTVSIPRKVFTSKWMTGPENWNSIPTLTNYALKTIPLFFLLICIIYILNKWPPLKKFDYKIVVLFLFMLVVYSIIIILFISMTSTYFLYQRVIVFFAFAGLFISIFELIRFFTFSILNHKKIVLKNSEILSVLINGFGISGILQIYPTHDPRHMWWGMPFLIITLFGYISRKIENSYKNIRYNLVAAILILPMLIVSGLGIQKTFSHKLISIDFPTPFYGMQVSENKYETFKRQYDFLKNNIKANEKVYFQCTKGEILWLPVFDGRYHSRDLWFADFSYYPGNPPPTYLPKVNQKVVICGDDIRLKSILQKYDLRLVQSTTDLHIALKMGS